MEGVECIGTELEYGSAILTVNSSNERYFPLATFVDIVPRSIGYLITSAYPGTRAGSTGLRKNA